MELPWKCGWPVGKRGLIGQSQAAEFENETHPRVDVIANARRREQLPFCGLLILILGNRYLSSLWMLQARRRLLCAPSCRLASAQTILPQVYSNTNTPSPSRRHSLRQSQLQVLARARPGVFRHWLRLPIPARLAPAAVLPIPEAFHQAQVGGFIVEQCGRVA